MPPPTELNYSLGVLIILLMFFWFVCKCIGQNHYQIKREPLTDDTHMIYGNTPIALNDSPVPYIYLNNSNVVLVPNSKTAYRHLFDKELIPCGIDTKNDKEMSTMYLKKKGIEKYEKMPRGMTSDRNKYRSDRIDRIPMPSF